MKSRWITHKGKRIFYVDLSNFGVDKQTLKAELDTVIATLSQEPPKSVLALSDANGTVGTPDVLAMMQGTVSKTSPYVRKRAVVGASGVRKGLIDLINRFTGQSQFATFDNIESARDWLVSD